MGSLILLFRERFSRWFNGYPVVDKNHLDIGYSTVVGEKNRFEPPHWTAMALKKSWGFFCGSGFRALCTFLGGLLAAAKLFGWAYCAQQLAPAKPPPTRPMRSGNKYKGLQTTINMINASGEARALDQSHTSSASI